MIRRVLIVLLTYVICNTSYGSVCTQILNVLESKPYTPGEIYKVSFNHITVFELSEEKIKYSVFLESLLFDEVEIFNISNSLKLHEDLGELADSYGSKNFEVEGELFMRTPGVLEFKYTNLIVAPYAPN